MNHDSCEDQLEIITDIEKVVSLWEERGYMKEIVAMHLMQVGIEILSKKVDLDGFFEMISVLLEDNFMETKNPD